MTPLFVCLLFTSFFVLLASASPVPQFGFPHLHVLDAANPAAVAHSESASMIDYSTVVYEAPSSSSVHISAIASTEVTATVPVFVPLVPTSTIATDPDIPTPVAELGTALPDSMGGPSSIPFLTSDESVTASTFPLHSDTAMETISPSHIISAAASNGVERHLRSFRFLFAATAMTLIPLFLTI